MFVSLASASVYRDNWTNLETQTGGTYTAAGGLNFTVNSSRTLFVVYTNTTVNGAANGLTDAWLFNNASGSWTLQNHVTKTAAADNFNFSSAGGSNSLLQGIGYSLKVNTSGAAVQRGQGVAGYVIPTNLKYMQIQCIVDPTTAGNPCLSTGWYIDIRAIETSAAAALPTVTLISPANATNWTSAPVQLQVNVTTPTDAIVNVSLFLDGVLSSTNTSGINGTYIFNVSTIGNPHSWMIDAYNSNGQTNSSVQYFSLDWIQQYAESHSTSALEGTTTSFYANFTTNSTSAISTATLIYNGTSYTGTVGSIGSGNYSSSVSILLPTVSADTNVTVYWNISQANGYYRLFQESNQTITNFGLDNCSTNTLMIFNMTLLDEDTQTKINATGSNSSIKVNLYLYPNSSKIVPVLQYSSLYNQTNPARVCISQALGTSSFVTDGQIEYTANNYADEFYNLQSYNLNASSNPSQNISLFDLMTSRDQVFVISYKDTSFLPVANAIIQVGRLYVDQGISQTVEAPITDSNGETVANLVVNDVIYTFTVVKNGQTLGVFQNMLAKCQNPAISTCEIDLNSFSSTFPVTNFTVANDFNYTLTYDKTTRVVLSTFTIPSNSVSTVVLNVTTSDALETQLCTQSVTTSSGSLACVVPSTFGNGTATAWLYRDGYLIAYGQVNFADSPTTTYNGIIIFLTAIMMLTLIGASVSDHAVLTAIFILVGLIMMFALNLVVHNGFFGGIASILWIVILVILLAVKGSNRT